MERAERKLSIQRKKNYHQKESHMQITERDLLVLTWISEQYAITLDHLQVLLRMIAGKVTEASGKLSISRVYDIISRWKAAGLVQYGRLLYNQPSWVWLTSAGLRLIASSYRMCTPQPTQLAHYYAINQVRLTLERRGGGNWRSERAIRGDLRRSASWQGRKTHVVDGEWLTDLGERQAVEVELTAKPLKRLRPILVSSLRYTRIWYVVSTTSIQNLLEEAILSLEPEVRTRFLVSRLADLKDLL